MNRVVWFGFVYRVGKIALSSLFFRFGVLWQKIVFEKFRLTANWVIVDRSVVSGGDVGFSKGVYDFVPVV